jgi:hypothetical protein
MALWTLRDSEDLGNFNFPQSDVGITENSATGQALVFCQLICILL